jgi:hypothetical protein
VKPFWCLCGGRDSKKPYVSSAAYLRWFTWFPQLFCHPSLWIQCFLTWNVVISTWSYDMVKIHFN